VVSCLRHRVCDQGSTNRAAIKELCGANTDRPSPYYFVVNGNRICTIFDVPHLLKNTRNALIDCAIEFSNKKHAKFEHIQAAFNFDQQIRTYKHLPKLKNEYFNFKDSFMKMKVKVAAQQLSHTVAAAKHLLIKVTYPQKPCTLQNLYQQLIVYLTH
jgi:hypothetical protein